MDPEDQLKLSFYKEISSLGNSKNVSLVKKIDTNEIFVRKEYAGCDTRVFDLLMESRFNGIPKIYECIRDTDENRTTVIEEHINGKTLRTILDINGTLPDDEVISIAASICDILRPLHMHEPPIIHRDIKPDNVIINEEGKVFLLDFDASKIFNAGEHRDTELLGTETYAAPEQYGFLQSDPRTDIYAIGILIREMTTGSPESCDNNSNAFGEIIKTCTCMDPEDRYQNVTDLKSVLIQKLPPKEPSPATSSKVSESYALPGFRGNSTGVKIFAFVMYLLVIYSCLTYVEEGISTPALWVNRVLVFITIMVLILFYGNYRGVLSELPLTNSSRKSTRVVGYILYTFIIIFILGLFASLTDKLL